MIRAASIHGLMAEFERPEQILEATRRAHAEGYRHMDAYTPYPVEGLATELGLPRTRVRRHWRLPGGRAVLCVRARHLSPDDSRVGNQGRSLRLKS